MFESLPHPHPFRRCRLLAQEVHCLSTRGSTTRDTTGNANAVTEKSAMSVSRYDVMS